MNFEFESNFESVKTVAISLASWAEADSVEDHDSKWHEFGVLGHIEKVIDNARRIKEFTGIDIIKVAVWHDIGKFIVRKEKKDKQGSFNFKGHEEASAVYLQNNSDFSEEELFLVANHGVIRGKSTVEEIITLCRDDKQLIAKLILLCAADTSGKGFPPAQKVQRHELAPKFAQLVQEAGLGEDLIILVHDIVLSW